LTVPSFFSWKFWYASGAASSAHRIDPHVPFAVPHNRFHCFPFRPGAVILALFVGYPRVRCGNVAQPGAGRMLGHRQVRDDTEWSLAHTPSTGSSKASRQSSTSSVGPWTPQRTIT
jgi:hypothetical protein